MTRIIPPAELRMIGTEVLVRELGYADAMRFLLQFDSGIPGADYTRERRDILPELTIDEMMALSRQYLKKAGSKKAPKRKKSA